MLVNNGDSKLIKGGFVRADPPEHQPRTEDTQNKYTHVEVKIFVEFAISRRVVSERIAN